jgi:hypothetical protein
MNGKKTVRQVQNCHSVSSRKTLNLLKQPDSSLFFAQGLISTLGRVNDTCMFCTSVVKVTVPPLLTQLYRRSALCWTGASAIYCSVGVIFTDIFIAIQREASSIGLTETDCCVSKNTFL